MVNGQKIWNIIIANVKTQISTATFKTWFAGAFVCDYQKTDTKEFLVVGLKNNFQKVQVETRYLQLIYAVARKRGFAKVEVKFVVAKNNEEELGKQEVKNTPLFSGVAPTYLSLRKSDGLVPSHVFENFVVGPSNNLAFLAFEQVAGDLGSTYNPLFVWGPTGVGKTHLLQALGNEILNKVIDAKVIYASAEKFTNDYVGSLQNRTIHSFRQKYRGCDLLLIDDVQFLAGKDSTQDEFFNTFNELYLSRRQIVLACDRHPKDLGKLKERLINRFLGGMTVDIGKPDLELKIAILKTKCKERGLTLSDDVLNYIAGGCQNGVRELEGVLVHVLLMTKLAPGEIRLEEVKKVIENSREMERVAPTPGKIMETVARYFKISSADLSGSRRKARLVFARQVLMYLLRQELGLSLVGIGQLLGGRDHSTVLYGIDKVGREMIANQQLKDEVLRIRSSF